MNKPFYILFFVFASALCKAQTNLVPNGSFENYTTCPIDNMLTSTGINIVNGWFAIVDDLAGTPDYYNICNNSLSGTVGIPNNFWGSQFPFHGNAYVGVVLEGKNCPIDSIGYSEYIQCKLLQPMVACSKYKISFNVSWSELGTFAFSKLGAVFTSDTLRKNGTNLILYTPDVSSNIGFIGDSINWVTISGSYIAKGGEQFMTIGYFGNPVIDTLFVKPSPIFYPNPFANYYIDSVNLILDEPCEEIPNIFSPNNDGINDFWIPNMLEGESVVIFDRWGIKMFESNKMQNKWDGRTTSGLICTDGIYFFVIEGTKSKNQKKGFIQLVR